MKNAGPEHNRFDPGERIMLLRKITRRIHFFRRAWRSWRLTSFLSSPGRHEEGECAENQPEGGGVRRKTGGDGGGMRGQREGKIASQRQIGRQQLAVIGIEQAGNSGVGDAQDRQSGFSGAQRAHRQ